MYKSVHYIAVVIELYEWEGVAVKFSESRVYCIIKQQ